MKFSKHYQPQKNRKPRRQSPHSEACIAERREEMYKLLAAAKDDAERDAIIKAFEITIRP